MAGLTTILADVRYPLLWAFGGLCALLFYLRHRRRVRTFLLGAVTGLLSLVLLHLFGGTIAPTLSWTNLLIATVFGIPGTALILLAGLL